MPDQVLPSQAMVGQAVLGQAVLGHAVQSQAAKQCAASTLSEAISAMNVSSVNKVKNLNMKEVARIKDMEKNSAMEENTDTSITKNELERKLLCQRKVLVTAALAMLWWRKCLVKQWFLLLHPAYQWCSVTLSVSETNHEKCLNNSIRAISVKSEAASALASVGHVSTWSVYCQIEPSLICLTNHILAVRNL